MLVRSNSGSYAIACTLIIAGSKLFSTYIYAIAGSMQNVLLMKMPKTLIVGHDSSLISDFLNIHLIFLALQFLIHIDLIMMLSILVGLIQK